MPRDGSGIYTIPPGTHGITNTAISSSAYNTYVDDVAQDLNIPRPIVAGGTGASTASGALTNLGAVAKIGDTMTGKLTINGHATDQTLQVIAPNTAGQSYGIAIQAGTNVSDTALDVANATGSRLFEVRGDGAVVATYSLNSASLVINQPSTNWAASITSPNIAGGSLGLIVHAGTNTADYPLVLTNANSSNLFFVNGVGNATVTGTLTAAELDTAGDVKGRDIHADRGDGTGTYYFGNTTTRYIYYNNDTFQLAGGALNLNSGGLTSAGTITVQGGGMDITGKTVVHGTNTGDWPAQVLAPSGGNYGLLVCGGTSASDYGLQVSNAAQNTVLFAVHGNGDILNAASHNVGLNLLVGGQGYKPGGGSWADSSDARIKDVLGDYTAGLAEVTALQPRRFTYKGNDTADQPTNSAAPYRNSGHFVVANAGTEYSGLIAQEVETVMPEMVSQRDGFIDGEKVTDLRTVDTTPLLYALINSVKELTARIQALEAR
jgi:hypothetical protein